MIEFVVIRLGKAVFVFVGCNQKWAPKRRGKLLPFLLEQAVSRTPDVFALVLSPTPMIDFQATIGQTALYTG